MSAAGLMPAIDVEAGAVDPIQAVREAMAAFAAGLEAGNARRAQLEAIEKAGHAALSAQSRAAFVASRADRAARGPQPARLVRATRPENNIRLTSDAAEAIAAFLGVGKRWRREDMVNVPRMVLAALEIGESETPEDADRLAFDRLAYLFQHQPAFKRGCRGLRLPEGGVPAETVGIEPPRHAPIVAPETDDGRALDHIGHDHRARRLADFGNPAFPTIEEENSARNFGWRAMVAAHRVARRTAGAAIGEAQAENEVARIVPGWARAVGITVDRPHVVTILSVTREVSVGG